MKKLLHSEYLPVILLIAVSLGVGLWTIHDYGESWDEYNFFRYASESLSAYAGLFHPGFHLEFTDPTLRYYGAWFLTVIVLTARLFPHWYISDVAHLLTFLVFQCGVLVMYLLARRWFKPLAAFGAALLFAAQPVLWGHAFINARDIPFLVGFLASIHFGLKMVDSLSLQLQTRSKAALPVDALPPAKKIILMFLTFLGLIGFGLLALHLRIGWLSRANLLADTSSARDLDLYLRPLLATFWAAVTFFCLPLAWTALLFLPSMPRLRSHLWTNELRPYTRLIADCLRNRDFVIASLVLGLTIGIRVLGVAAFGLVGIFLFKKNGRGAFFPLFVSLLMALVIVYVSWPYIWSEPILRLLLVLRVMLRFPWPGQVLFGGMYYAGNELPRSYLPTLFGLQLTEPLLLLALVGFVWSLWQIVKKKNIGEILLLSLLWVGLPLAAAMIGHPYIYDNFRQLLFILPPLFLLAGLGLEWILEFARPPLVRAAILVVLVLPSIYGMAVLHPYEYVYYNSFTGGVTGAFRRYEMDYWGTSFREAADYLNANAPQNAKVIVWGPNTTLWRYLRTDIKLYDARQPNAPTKDFYAVLSTRDDNDLLFHSSLPALFSVGRQGATLAVVKYVP